jgi:predicted PolB exonuclease-like 3'-5' exonuclease
MPERTVIVFDVETVPDLLAAARMLGLGAANEAEVREALGPGFPKRSEADLIKAFAEKVGQLKPQLITFNGHAFDLPVLNDLIPGEQSAQMTIIRDR